MIELAHHIDRAIRIHAEKTYPFECVGFLYGKTKGLIKEFTSVLRVENSVTENKRRRFKVEPSDYLKAENYALDNDLELLGIYHSHPDHLAIPSEHDRKQAMPVFSYFIVSVMNGKSEKLTSWVLNPNFEFEEEYINHNELTLKN